MLPLPSSALAWLPMRSTLRFAALAALAVALAAAGRRWAVLLPSGAAKWWRTQMRQPGVPAQSTS